MIKIRNEDYLIVFGQNSKRLRLRKKLSRETLAVYTNTETMQVYRIEKGKALETPNGCEAPGKT